VMFVRVAAASARGSHAARASALCGAALLMGCSPIAYAQRARSAERAVAAAEQAEAAKLAPYELTLAKVYLEKAREESGEAHYALSLTLLGRAEQDANRARLLAGARATGATP